MEKIRETFMKGKAIYEKVVRTGIDGEVATKQ